MTTRSQGEPQGPSVTMVVPLWRGLTYRNHTDKLEAAFLSENKSKLLLLGSPGSEG